MGAIIETRQLTHVYSQGTPFQHTALNAVDFSAQEGEYVAVIGRTGSGKSTLIQHLNGLLKPTSGQVLFEGTDIFESKERTRQVRCRVRSRLSKMSVPSKSTCPEVGLSRPLRCWIRVEFPDPVRPMIATYSPASAEKSTAFRAAC